jgi:hypothetical protein
MSEGKRLRTIGMFCLAVLVLFNGRGVSPLVAIPRLGQHDSRPNTALIRDLVAGLSERELRADVLALQEMGSRYAPSRGNLRAATYVKDAFVAAGLTDVSFDEFSYFDDQTTTYETTRNVVASKRGTTTPTRIVLIGAHFDSITHSAEDGRGSSLDSEFPSPGADDNATGVAAVLAAARLLAPYEFDCTLRFVLFSAEEAGIFGSARYAARSAREHENIVAMINLDMLGYVKQQPEDIDIIANTQSTWLLDRITDSASIYAPGQLIYRVINDTYDGSDHAPFWNNGYPAVCFMDDYYPSSPFYHTPRDTIDRLDGRFFLNCARLAVGTLAEVAGIHARKNQAAVPDALRQDGGLDWQKASGKKLLVTISPLANEAHVIDVSVPTISSNTSVSLGAVSSDRWGDPRYYAVGVCQRPRSRLVYVSSVKLRAPAGDLEHGIVDIVDSAGMRVRGRFDVGKHPSIGCFNTVGTRYYQPYWGEQGIDVFDTVSLKAVGRIPTPVAVTKLVVDNQEKRAIGISTESNTIVIIDLAKKSVEATIPNVPSPKDVALADDDLALVCSRGQGKILQVDMNARRVVGEVEVGPWPVRLIMSPQRDVMVCIHQSAKQVDVFDIARSNGSPILRQRKAVDLDEVVVDGVFADRDSCYFVSSDKCRIVGLALSSKKAFWAMRTGGVRARADTSRIVFIAAGLPDTVRRPGG